MHVQKGLRKLLRELEHTSRPVITDLDESYWKIQNLFIQQLNQDHGLSVTFSDWVTHDLSCTIPLRRKNVSHDDVMASIRRTGQTSAFVELSPFKRADDSLAQLAVQSNGFWDNIYAVTVRSAEMYAKPKLLTYRTLKNCGSLIRPQQVVFTEEKGAFAQGIGAVLAFEDSLQHTLDYLKRGIPVILFNRPWNIMTSRDPVLLPRECLDKKWEAVRAVDAYEDRGLYRVYDWREVYHAASDRWNSRGYSRVFSKN